MAKALIIYAHPWNGSFNHALLEAVEKGLKKRNLAYEIIDLYKENFNPSMSVDELKMYSKGEPIDPKVKNYQEKIKSSSELYILFPVWWGTVPAILKGFFDKVFLKGWAFEPLPTGMLKPLIHNIKKTAVISTMEAPVFFYNLFMGNPIKHQLIKGTLKTCGIKTSKWFELGRVVGVKDKTRKEWLAQVEEYASVA